MYESNSRMKKPTTTDRPKITPVTKAVKKETKGVDKVVEMFFGKNVKDLKSHIVTEVIIPTIKRTILDGLSMSFFNKPYSSSGRSTTLASKVRYDDIFSSRTRFDEPYGSSVTSNKRPEYDEMEIPTRGEAEHVLECMCQYIDEYGVARLSDFYELIGRTPEHTDNKFGWQDLSTAKISISPNGYLIKFPRIRPI